MYYDALNSNGKSGEQVADARTESMISLTSQLELRAAQNLPFCYLCGADFALGDQINRDHVPPKTVFSLRDRQPLILRTHYNCNRMHSSTDKKIGQLIALKYGRIPQDPSHRRLRFANLGLVGTVAVTNLNIDAAIWRWISGFHAALYHGPLLVMGHDRSLVTPFNRVGQQNGYYKFSPIRPQHSLFVKLIKINRIRNSLDRIIANNGKLKYECLWAFNPTLKMALSD